MAGLGGAYLSIVSTRRPGSRGMTAGAVWIVIALTSFAMWDPRLGNGGGLSVWWCARVCNTGISCSASHRTC